MNFINRRTFVQRTGLAGLSMLAVGLGANRAVADPDPAPGTAAPSLPGASNEPDIFPFQLGGTDAFIIHDGAIPFPNIQPAFAPEAKPAEVEEAMKKSFLPSDHLALSLNVLVLKSKSGVMLLDAGAGNAMGPAAGKLLRGLARVGIAPQDVKTIFVTHAHPDHIAGLVDDSNALVFPSARIIAAKTEVDFWMADAPDVSKMRTPPEATTQMLGGIKKILVALKPNLDLKEPGKLTPEVELISGPGHTPGHSLFRLTQGEDKLLVLGDAVHSFALQFPHPEWTMMYDVDPALAAKTRTKIFKDAASERTTVMAFHLPFPGIGHVRAAGSGFEWVPRPWVV
jgi:glyoxylase-like metal-dependent hydrolase (beta-lactamase superfamily II)